jgi:hypothetical protein
MLLVKTRPLRVGVWILTRCASFFDVTILPPWAPMAASSSGLFALQDCAQWLSARPLIDPSTPEQRAGWPQLDPLIPPNSTDPILDIVRS